MDLDLKTAISKLDNVYEAILFGGRLDDGPNAQPTAVISIPQGELSVFSEDCDGLICVEHRNISLSIPTKVFEKLYEVLPELPKGYRYLSADEYAEAGPPSFRAYIFVYRKFFKGTLTPGGVQIKGFPKDSQIYNIKNYGSKWVAIQEGNYPRPQR